MEYKVVYVLVSSEDDYYLEECLVSIYSLKKYNKNVEVILVVDDFTEMRLKSYEEKVSELVDNIVSQTFESNLSSRLRSRFLKTSLRELIKGDFLFLDCDTIVSGDIEGIFHLSCDVGMVLDGHRELCLGERYEDVLKNIQVFEKDVSVIEYKYFNSGVIYCRDTEIAHKIFRMWHSEYIKSNRYGNLQDQLPLHFVNSRIHGKIVEMDGKYNCQMDRGVKYLYDARIIHYLGFQYSHSSMLGKMSCLMHEIADETIFINFRKEGFKITKRIEEIIDNPKGAIRDVITLPTDTVHYKVMNTNVFLLDEVIYSKFPRLYKIKDKMLGFLLMVYRKLKNYRHRC